MTCRTLGKSPCLDQERQDYIVPIGLLKFFIFAVIIGSTFGAANAQGADGLGTPGLVINGEVARADPPPRIVSGRLLVPLRLIAEHLGMAVTWQPQGERVILRGDGVAVELAVGSGKALLNGREVLLDVPPVIVNDRTLAPLRFVGEAFGAQVRWDAPSRTAFVNHVHRLSLDPGTAGGLRVADGLVSVTRQDQAPAGPLAGRVIVLDPGHGGVDPGAPAPGSLEEKDITLSIARKARELLAEAGARVVLTRDGDQTIGLYERADLANQAGAELFVSIHANTSPFRSAAGIETYYYPGSTEGRRLAAILQRALVARLGRPDREVRRADFVVVREPAAPAALIECGYLSNREEARLLTSGEFQLRIARAIAEGIIRYFTPADTG